MHGLQQKRLGLSNVRDGFDEHGLTRANLGEVFVERGHVGHLRVRTSPWQAADGVKMGVHGRRAGRQSAVDTVGRVRTCVKEASCFRALAQEERVFIDDA